jgi:hypothetical protein
MAKGKRGQTQQQLHQSRPSTARLAYLLHDGTCFVCLRCASETTGLIQQQRRLAADVGQSHHLRCIVGIPKLETRGQRRLAANSWIPVLPLGRITNR